MCGGQGPPTVRDSPPPAASRRNRENPAPLPTGSKDRRGRISPAASTGNIDADIACGFAFGYPEEGFRTLPLLAPPRSGIIGGALAVYGPVCITRCAVGPHGESLGPGDRGRAVPSLKAPP